MREKGLTAEQLRVLEAWLHNRLKLAKGQIKNNNRLTIYDRRYFGEEKAYLDTLKKIDSVIARKTRI